jgi:hypothetical protein
MSSDRYADIGIRVIMPNHELCRANLGSRETLNQINEATRHNQRDFKRARRASPRTSRIRFSVGLIVLAFVWTRLSCPVRSADESNVLGVSGAGWGRESSRTRRRSGSPPQPSTVAHWRPSRSSGSSARLIWSKASMNRRPRFGQRGCGFCLIQPTFQQSTATIVFSGRV